MIGTGFHGGMEAYYRGRKTGEIVPNGEILEGARMAFVEALPEGWASWDTDEGTAFSKVATMLESYFANGNQWPNDYEVLEVEWKFLLDVPGTDLQITGTPDLILRAPSGLVQIDDHKTSGKGWKKGKEDVRNTSQAPFYMYSWFLATGEMPAMFSYSVMRYEGQFDRRFVTPTTAEVMATIEKARTLAPILDMTRQGLALPGNTTHFLCRPAFCDHWHRCPFGSAMNGN